MTSRAAAALKKVEVFIDVSVSFYLYLMNTYQLVS